MSSSARVIIALAQHPFDGFEIEAIPQREGAAEDGHARVSLALPRLDFPVPIGRR